MTGVRGASRAALRLVAPVILPPPRRVAAAALLKYLCIYHISRYCIKLFGLVIMNVTVHNAAVVYAFAVRFESVVQNRYY